MAWEHDSTIEARTQAAFEREAVTVPEAHSGSAYERRWQQAAVEEVSHLAEPAFHSTTRSDFSERVPLTGELRADSRGAEASPNPSVSRFQVLSPSEELEDQKDSSEEPSDDSARRHGRRSARSARSARPRPVATGAWSEDPKTVKPEREFVYYTDRQNWEEEAEIDTRRLQARWQSRDMDRWMEEKRKVKLREEEKLMEERIRREAYGEVDDEEQLKAEEIEDESLSEGEEAIEPLPPKARVVPIILKTKSVSQFDMLMEEIERVGDFARLRIVIVHGGLGPVIPKDIVHAEVEKRYGYCPVYAFQVGVHPVALGQAHAEQIDIRRFNVFTELLEDLMERCGRINQKNVDKRYIDSLKEDRPSIRT